MIFDSAKKIPDLDENKVLCDLANFQAKENFFSQQFLWQTVDQISSIAWWSGLCKNTELSKIAVRFLKLPATSAACERSFSTYSAIHTSKRNRLTNDRAAKIVYMAHNLKLQSSHSQQFTAPQESTTSTSSTSTSKKPEISEEISESRAREISLVDEVDEDISDSSIINLESSENDEN